MTYHNRPPTFPLRPAFRALDNESFGLALDGQTLEACVSDPATPANNYLGPMGSKFAYPSPSSKTVCNRHGVLVSGTTLRCDHDPGTLDGSTAALNSLPGLKAIPIAGATVYSVGKTVVVSNAANINQWMAGEVVNWNAETKTVTIDAYAAGGLFSGSDWKVIVARGARVEPQRANLLSNSGAVGGSGWVLITAGATQSAAIAPDGTVSMSQITPSGAGNSRAVSPSATSLVEGQSYTASIFVAAGTSDRSGLTLYNSGQSANYGANVVNWVNETPEVTFALGVTNGSVNFVGVHGGRKVYRIGWTVVLPSGQTTCRLGVIPDNVAPVDGSMFAWGAQLEAGSTMTSYIPTVGAQVSCAADAIGIPTSAFPYNGGTGTLQVNGVTVSPSIVSGQLRLPQGHIKSMRWVPTP